MTGTAAPGTAVTGAGVTGITVCPTWGIGAGPRHGGRLRRSSDGKLLGGVAEGLSKRIGIDVTIIRVGFVLFGLASGTGVAAYLLAWLFLPVEGEKGNIAQKALEDRRGMALAIAFLPALIAVLVLGAALGAGWLDSLAWPAFVSAAGLVLVWRNAPEDEHAALERVLNPVIQFAVPENRSLTRISVRAVLAMALSRHRRVSPAARTPESSLAQVPHRRRC